MKKLFTSKTTWILIAIFAIAIFLRFYQIGAIPAGLTNDEANAGYDAYSVLLSGKDQWDNFLPIANFVGFGDYQPPINRYSMILPISIFGLNAFSVRIAAALAGVLSVVVLYLLAKALFNKSAALFSALMLTIMPWAVGLNRIGHESNLGILFLVIALFFGLAHKTKKSLYLAAFFLALSMYTYSAYMLYAPLTLLVILSVNYKRKIGFSFLLKPVILFLIILLPIFLQKNVASVRFSQVGLTNNITSIGLINTLNDERGQCLKGLSPIICKISNNKISLFTTTFVKNYLLHFSPQLLYTDGTSTQFAVLPQRGLDYLFSFLPLILGSIYLLKKSKQKKISYAFFTLFLLSPLPDSLTSGGNYIRASLMIPFLAILDGLGIYYLFDFVRTNKNLRIAFIAIFTIAVVIGAVPFFLNYVTYFKNNYAIFSQYGYADLVKKTVFVENNYDRIYVSRHLNDTKQYIYFLFYTKYDPVKYQKKQNVDYSLASDNWLSIDRINNLFFVQNIPTTEELTEIPDQNKILLISNPVDFPQDVKSVFVVKDKLGNVIFKAVRSSDLLEYDREQKITLK